MLDLIRRRSPVAVRAGVLPLSVLALSLAACGGGDSGDDQGGGSGAAAGSGSTSGSDPFGTAGAAAAAGNGGVTWDPGGTAGTTGNPQPDLCGGSTYQPEAAELDMYIMMDRSGSMIGISIPPTPQVWEPIGSAIGNFVTLPEAAGMGVGISFFPYNSIQPDGTVNYAMWCDENLYANPAPPRGAPIGTLPGYAGSVQQAIIDNGPDPNLANNMYNGIEPGNTPTRVAMLGALAYARSWANANPARKTIILLATDGAPNICNSNIAAVSAVAADGYNGSPSIQTFVIGIGDIAGLNEVAAAGGSGQAIIVDANPQTASQQFLDAMNVIRGLALPCDYGVPQEALSDPTMVNLDFTDNAGATQRVGYVPDSNGCDGARGGWYYDDANAPTRIYTCPATCQLLKQNSSGKMDVAVGCATELLVQ